MIKQNEPISIDTQKLRHWLCARKMLISDLPREINIGQPIAEVDIECLTAITQALNITERELILTERSSHFSRRGQTYSRTEFRNNVPYYRYEHLATAHTNPTVMPLRIEVLCSDIEKVAYSIHDGPELVYVAIGPVIYCSISQDQQLQNRLETGDSVFIEPQVPHSFISIGTPCEIIAVNF